MRRLESWGGWGRGVGLGSEGFELGSEWMELGSKDFKSEGWGRGGQNSGVTKGGNCPLLPPPVKWYIKVIFFAFSSKLTRSIKLRKKKFLISSA